MNLVISKPLRELLPRVCLAISVILTFTLGGCQHRDEQPPAKLHIQAVNVSGGETTVEVAGEGLDASARGVLLQDTGNRHQLVSELPLWGTLFDVAVQGDYAYIAANIRGTMVASLTDPTTPRVVGSILTAGKTLQVLPLGELLVSANGKQGLQMIDITRPDQPTLLSSLPTSDYVFAVAGSAELVAAAEGDNGLLLFAPGDGLRPKALSRLQLPGQMRSVCIRKEFAYLVGSSHLVAVDISDPEKPRIAASLPLPNAGYHVVANGDQLLVSLGKHGLLVVDASNSRQLRQLGVIADLGHVFMAEVNGDRAYLASSIGTLVLQLHPQGMPELLGGVTNRNQVMAVSSYRELVLALNSRFGIEVFDLRQPLPMQFNRSPLQAQDFISFRTVKGELLVERQNPPTTLLGEIRSFGSLELLPLAANRPPLLVASDASDMIYADPYLALATSRGLWIYRAPASDNPQLVQHLLPEQSIGGMKSRDGFVFAAAGEAGLVVLQLGQNELPREISRLPLAGDARNIALAGNYAYILIHKQGLVVVDISAPEQPRIISRYQCPYPVEEMSSSADIEIAQQTAYIAAGPSGLLAIDISQPAAPELRALLTTGDYSRRLHIDADRLYLSAQDTLHVYDISQPGWPVALGTVDFPESIFDCMTLGDEVGVLTKSFGVLWSPLPIESSSTERLADGNIRFRFADVARGYYVVNVVNHVGEEELPPVLMPAGGGAHD